MIIFDSLPRQKFDVRFVWRDCSVSLSGDDIWHEVGTQIS